MAEPYSPSAEARLFPASTNPPARLSARDALLDRRESQQGLLQNAQREGKSSSNPQMEKIKKTQAEIDLVKNQLHHNIEAMQERGESLDHLQDKTNALGVQSKSFRTQAAQVRRQMWWKNMKWTICLAILVIVIIAGAVGGGVKAHQVIEHQTTVTATATPTPGS